MTEKEYRDLAGDLFECDAKEIARPSRVDNPVVYFFLGGLISGLLVAEKMR